MRGNTIDLELIFKGGDDMQAITRNVFLFMSKNKVLNKIAKKRGVHFVSGKIIGGKDFLKTIPYIQKLNESGLSTTVDHLGEFVNSKDIAKERANECIHTIRMIKDKKLDSHVSLKLTSLGLDISRDLLIKNMVNILDEAEKSNVMITIDMEDATRCHETIHLFKQFKESYTCVSTVLQAYLYRSEQDLKDLSTYQPFLRLVKGAYKESPNVAFADKKDVDDNYKKLIKHSLEYGLYTAIATHDDTMIDYTKELATNLNISKQQFEFQMLYGMRNNLQSSLVQDGYKVRVYVPYGEDWYGYFMRRLAERPANIAFAFKGLTKK